MTRIRQFVLALGIGLALVLSFGAPASADPGDPGTTTFSSATTTLDRGRPTTTTSADPGDPGTTY